MNHVTVCCPLQRQWTMNQSAACSDSSEHAPRPRLIAKQHLHQAREMPCTPSKPTLEEVLRDARIAGSRSFTPPPSEVPPSSTCEPTLTKFVNPRQTRQTAPSAAAPPRRTFFDPWNSSGTGHQRAENRLSGSTTWRASRNLKLGEQYKAGIDGTTDAKSLRTRGQQSLAEAWASGSASRNLPQRNHADATGMQHEQPSANHEQIEEHAESDGDFSGPASGLVEKQIFAGLCFYINGSTAPLVSDLKLKRLLAAHGARHSVTLGRRTVTHVILGPVSKNGGAGGGLAATKVQKEIARSSGKTVKFINAKWVLDSIQAGHRLAESRYSPLTLTPKVQNNIVGMMCDNASNKERG
ncbi:brca1 c terminus domain-containing [Pyrenophora seminiperda CCB06]|uniref:Brca1 c terminus domain-containing n=1 Tax=Pyrenophora seminiperda CCB06 TaxID=1302712 RepID=A0A3M7M4X0_9PLEO|nr:brca1 c terminus domain-containing [Pyrenophora seminiperda CCB06]